jgi:hypothetical protein
VKEVFHFFRAEPDFWQESFEILKVGDAVDVERTLFSTETSIEVTPQSDMVRISGKLTDMVDVLGDVVQADSGGFRG